MLDRIWRMIVKEFLQLRRDKYARFRLIVPPIIQMLIFGYAATFEVFHVSTVVLDRDYTQESREFVDRLSANGRFEIVHVAKDERAIAGDLDNGDATVAVV